MIKIKRFLKKSKKMNEWKLGPTLPQKWGHEIGKWGPYWRRYKNFLYGLLPKNFLVCPCLFEKKMDDAQTQILGPDIHTYTQRTCIIRQKNLCLGSIKMCLVITRHILLGQLGSPWKKMQTLPFFCTISNQGFYFILAQFRQKVAPKKMAATSPKDFFF